VGTEVTTERHLGLGADPAAHTVAAHEHDEAAAGVHGFLQPVEPELALPDALLVAKYAESAPFQLLAEARRRIRVIAAVAQKDVIALGHPAALRTDPGRVGNGA
jgi:hypothetical protein